jgi:hypothetical protein
VRLEAGSPNQSRPLAGTSVAPGPYNFRVPPGVALTLRWGCDADGDGTIAGIDVAEAHVGTLAWDLPLDLQLPDAERAARFALVAPNTRAAPGLHVVPGGAGATPQGIAPADGAVGPPLPDGPPADAGPPPPTGSAPPPTGSAPPPAAAPR